MTVGTMSARVGANIRRHREGRGISTRTFAAMLGEVDLHLSQSMLSRIENGQRTVTVEHLVAFAEILDVAPSDLLEEPTSPDVSAVQPQLGRREIDVVVAPGVSTDLARFIAGMTISANTQQALQRIGATAEASLRAVLDEKIRPLIVEMARQAETQQQTPTEEDDDSGIVT